MKFSTEARVGIVTIVGIVLLAYIIMHLGGFSFGVKGYSVEVAFAGVNGLKTGNVVRYAGVEVGRVSTVNIAEDGIRVGLLINNGVSIPRAAKFQIGTDGLMGEKFVSIIPVAKVGVGEVLQPGDFIKGEEPQGMDKLMATATETLVEVKRLVQSINEFMGDPVIKTAFKDTILNAKESSSNLQTMSASMARMAVNNETDVSTMVANLTVMSNRLRQVAGRVDTMIASVDNNGHTAADLKETIANIKTTSARVEKMAAALKNVITDPETAKNLKDTLRNTKVVTEKADKMLNKFGGLWVKPSLEVLYGKNNQQYFIDGQVRVTISSQNYAILGLSGICKGNRFNLQVGKGNELSGRRFGIIDSKPGVGLDTSLGSRLRFFFDVYDPNDVKVKFRTQYQLTPDTFLVGQINNLNKPSERNSFFGVRTTF